MLHTFWSITGPHSPKMGTFQDDILTLHTEHLVREHSCFTPLYHLASSKTPSCLAYEHRCRAKIWKLKRLQHVSLHVLFRWFSVCASAASTGNLIKVSQKVGQLLGTVPTTTADTSMPYTIVIFCTQYQQMREQVHALRCTSRPCSCAITSIACFKICNIDEGWKAWHEFLFTIVSAFICTAFQVLTRVRPMQHFDSSNPVKLSMRHAD